MRIFFLIKTFLYGFIFATLSIVFPLLVGPSNLATEDGEVPEFIQQSLVQIYAPTGERATGFHVQDRRGKMYIMTVDHVCFYSSEHMYVRPYHQSKTVMAKIISTDSKIDSCLLESPFPKARPLAMRFVWSIGTSIWAYGYPMGYGRVPFISGGKIVKLGPLNLVIRLSQQTCEGLGGTWVDENCHKYHPLILYTTYEARPGMSGGPVIDELGYVVGMTMARLGVTGYGAMIPAFTLLEFLNRRR